VLFVIAIVVNNNNHVNVVKVSKTSK